MTVPRDDLEAHVQAILRYSPDREPAPRGEYGAALLAEVEALLRTYVVVSDEQAVAVVLWLAHAHAIEAADATPYLAVTSAEKRSGKSRIVVELLPLLVPRPLAAANISTAALARSIGAEPPATLLLDEADTVFGRGRGMSERAEELRGILNAGYQRGATYTRMAGQGAGMKPEQFSIFGAKAIGAIGELPDTVADRSILIRMKRKARGERVERFRRRRVASEAAALRARLAEWAQANLEELTEADPELPDALDDRAQDGWEPLLAIADAAGGSWAERARAAAVALSAGRDGADDASLGVRLLADLRVVFDAAGADRLSTAQLTTALNGMEESPWGAFKDGAGIGARALARMLGEYDVSSSTVRLADGTQLKGYKRESLEDPWERYAPSEAHSIRPSVPSRMGTGMSAVSHPSHAPWWDASENGENPHGKRDGTAGRIETPQRAPGRDSDDEYATRFRAEKTPLYGHRGEP